MLGNTFTMKSTKKCMTRSQVIKCYSPPALWNLTWHNIKWRLLSGKRRFINTIKFLGLCFLSLACLPPQDSSEIHFKVKMTTHLKKLKESYSQRQVNQSLPVTQWHKFDSRLHKERAESSGVSHFKKRNKQKNQPLYFCVFPPGRPSEHAKVSVWRTENRRQPDSQRGSNLSSSGFTVLLSSSPHLSRVSPFFFFLFFY